MVITDSKNKAILAFLKQITSIFIAVIIFSNYHMTAWAQEESPEIQPDFSSMSEAKDGIVARVVDPKTLQLKDGRIIALASLDFPDFDYYNPGELSVLSVKILRDMLENKQIKIYQTKNKERGRINRMGHHIAQVTLMDSKIWAQAILLRLGLARVRTTPTNADLAITMYAHEDFARSEKEGLWKLRAFAVHAPDNAHLFTNNFGIIEGKVKSISFKQGQVYVNFGHNWKQDLTIAVPSSKRKIFMRAGLDPKDWGGKKIRVRGWLRDYNGPYIEIDHPESIEFIDTGKKEAKNDQ